MNAERKKLITRARRIWKPYRVFSLKRDWYYWVAPNGDIYAAPTIMAHDNMAYELMPDDLYTYAYKWLLGFGFCRVGLNDWRAEVTGKRSIPRPVLRLFNEWKREDKRRTVEYYRT